MISLADRWMAHLYHGNGKEKKENQLQRIAAMVYVTLNRTAAGYLN